MKKHLSTILFILAFLIGLSLLLYPSVSDYINSLHQSKAIAKYAEDVADLNEADFKKMWKDAEDYNKTLAKKSNVWNLSDRENKEYNDTLNINNGMMSYIEIPKIRCSLPICHGTDDGILQHSIGHLPGTSLPAGGDSTHCVLSGHRGLPSAKLFSELDRLSTGDRFMLRTLNQTLTYEIDQILIVLPNEVDSLLIEDGKDLCTLVTCTPYGVNSHRLLVRGHRVANESKADSIKVVADAIQIEPIIVAPLLAAPILIFFIIYAMMSGNRKKK